MFLVGLTGGIGSGKSTVADLLAERGAVVIDADEIAREVVFPGAVAFHPVIDRFGPEVVGPDGRIDRVALAQIVFADEQARKDLEAITHPAIGQVMAERMAAEAETDRIVVLDIPLLKDRHRMGVQAVLVVDCPEDLAVERLVKFRQFDEKDARRRIAAQITRDERKALADVVIDNSGSRQALHDAVDRVWEWLDQRRAQLATSEAHERQP